MRWLVMFGLVSACQRPPVAPRSAAVATCPRPPAAERDGQHDFDFEFGAWTTHLERRLHPLTGSATWVKLDGTSVVRKVWDGRANLGELEVAGQSGHVEGMTLRLYDPKSHLWNISFANSGDGELTPAMTGSFRDGRGEFFDHEMLNDKPICVRFVFSELKPTTFRFEQAFSGDNGETWEVNWIATFARTDS